MKKIVLGALGALLVVTGCANRETTCEAFRETFKQDKVMFAQNKADLTPESKQVLDKQIAWLKENPTKNVIVQGYTDPTGSTAHNWQLGMERAESVKAYFVENGINPNRISVVSFGERDLASTKNTPQSRKLDRRAVTVIVTE